MLYLRLICHTVTIMEIPTTYCFITIRATHSSALDCLLFTQPPLKDQPPYSEGAVKNWFTW